MGTFDSQDFFRAFDVALARHATWRQGPDLEFNADLSDAQTFAVIAAKLGSEFVISLNRARLLASVLAGPAGCGERWAGSLLTFLEAVDAGDVDLASLTVSQLVDEERDVQ